MAESKAPAKKAVGHAKSQLFKTTQYKKDQAFRKNFRAQAEQGMGNAYIRDFCTQHKYKTKSDYSGIILRKRGWIVDVPGYEKVYCCNKYSTGNSAQDLVLISILLLVLWAFYVGWFASTIILWHEYGHQFLWFGAAMMTGNFSLIGAVVVSGYIADNAAYEEEQENLKMEAESKTHKL